MHVQIMAPPTTHGSEGERGAARRLAQPTLDRRRKPRAPVSELEQLATAPIARARKRDPKPLESVLRDIVALTYSDARAIVEPNRMAGLEL